MIAYEFKYRTHEKPYFVTMTFSPPMPLLTTFLIGIKDRYLYIWCLSAFDELRDNNKQEVEREGDIIRAEIATTITTFYDTFEESTKEIVLTDDFIKILDIWIEEKENFDKWKRKQCESNSD